MQPMNPIKAAAIENRRRIQKRLLALCLVLGSYAVLVSANKAHNASIEKNCPKNIYVIGQTSTALGPSYVCISKVQFVGPSPFLKD